MLKIFWFEYWVTCNEITRGGRINFDCTHGDWQEEEIDQYSSDALHYPGGRGDHLNFCICWSVAEYLMKNIPFSRSDWARIVGLAHRRGKHKRSASVKIADLNFDEYMYKFNT